VGLGDEGFRGRLVEVGSAHVEPHGEPEPAAVQWPDADGAWTSPRPARCATSWPRSRPHWNSVPRCRGSSERASRRRRVVGPAPGLGARTEETLRELTSENLQDEERTVDFSQTEDQQTIRTRSWRSVPVFRTITGWNGTMTVSSRSTSTSRWPRPGGSGWRCRRRWAAPASALPRRRS
jgi:hypothetical protein